MGLTVDIKESIVVVNDPANRATIERTAVQAVRMMLFTTTNNASWIADRLLRTSAYPLAKVSLKANRNAFKLQVGDLFRFSYDQYGIVRMVFRIVAIREDNLDNETISIDAVQDIDYLAATTLADDAPTGGDYELLLEIEPLTKTAVVEAPYVIAGDSVKVVSLAARETETETGYMANMSIDGGSSYNHLKSIPIYNPYGTLVADYGAGTYKIDDQTGFQVDFYNNDVDLINTTTRTNLHIGKNTALLGDEIISFQTITPVSGTIYKIENIARGLYDTERTAHTAGEDFFFIGDTFYRTTESPNLLVGTDRQFKLTPYNAAAVGTVADAQENETGLTGRAKTPYKPSSLKANGEAYRPTYTTDVVLTWNPRVRGDGAGLGSLTTVVASAPTYEGYFKVQVVVGGSVVRTQTNIEALTWTYTEAMNLSDNGALANSIEFRLMNCRDESSIIYCSSPEAITVSKA